MSALSKRAMAAYAEVQASARREEEERHDDAVKRALAFIAETFGPVEKTVKLPGAATTLYRVDDVYFEVREEWTTDQDGVMPWLRMPDGSWCGGLEPVRDLVELGIELAEMAKWVFYRNPEVIAQYRKNVSKNTGR
ncbi:MAG: hypothetical protein KGL39_16545 [Patescibacteria group bacterium]|nr:hypothetical protein [Patescibacteria group bacterium]